MGVLEGLEHLKLIIDHVFIAADILLEDDLHRNFFPVG